MAHRIDNVLDRRGWCSFSITARVCRLEDGRLLPPAKERPLACSPSCAVGCDMPTSPPPGASDYFCVPAPGSRHVLRRAGALLQLLGRHQRHDPIRMAAGDFSRLSRGAASSPSRIRLLLGRGRLSSVLLEQPTGRISDKPVNRRRKATNQPGGRYFQDTL